MVQWFYKGDYDATVTPSPAKTRPTTVIGQTNLLEKTVGDNTQAIDPAKIIESHLPTHTKVYSLASLLSIHSLQNLSATKFSTLAATHWPYDDLPDIIDSVFLSTPGHDWRLREVIVDVLVGRWREVVGMEEVLDVMAEWGDLAVAVLVGVAEEVGV